MKTRSILAIFLMIATTWYPSINGKELFKIAKMDSPDHILIMRVIEKAYRKLNIPIEFVELPGKRAILQSNSGDVDAELSRIFEVGNEYPSLIRVPTPIYWFDAVVFSKSKKFKVKGWDSLRSYRVGIMRGMVFAEKGVKGFSKVDVIDKPKNLFKMLDTDRVDIVVFSDLNGLYLIENEKFDKIFPLSPSLERIYAYHYVNKKHKNLVPKLDAIFQEMTRNGELQSMREEFTKGLTK